MGHTPAFPLRLTEPTPTQVTLVALALVQVNVVPWPLLIVDGVAVKVTVGATPGEATAAIASTVTVALADVVPPGPVAVTV